MFKMPGIIEHPGTRMGGLQGLKKFGLAGFAWIFKAGVVVGEDMRTILFGHAVKGLATALGQNHGLGAAHGRRIILIRLPAGTKDVGVGLETGMKRDNHQ
jgi:hypothetical protein